MVGWLSVLSLGILFELRITFFAMTSLSSCLTTTWRLREEFDFNFPIDTSVSCFCFLVCFAFCQGDEMGMLEDAWVGIASLTCVKFKASEKLI